MAEQTVTVSNRAGIHARPAAVIVQMAKDFKANIYLEKDNYRINGKSILGVITLEATYGSTIKVIAEGEDAEKAVQEIVALINSKFEEN